MRHRDPLRQQVVGNDAAVAPPPQDFGTHHGTTLTPRQSFQLVESSTEGFACGVICVIAERLVPPERVRRWRLVLAALAPAAERTQMPVRHPGFGERSAYDMRVELRSRPRARNR